jgi:hypothetical protein
MYMGQRTVCTIWTTEIRLHEGVSCILISIVESVTDG